MNELCCLASSRVHDTMRVRYSLRLILILFTASVCVVAHQAFYAAIRRQAMAAAKDAEGYTRRTESVAPKWLIVLLGPEYFHRIEKVNGQFNKVTDEHLAHFSRLPELRHVSTNHMWLGSSIGTFAIRNAGNWNDSPLVTDSGLRHVSSMKNLESLVLFNTAVTDKGLAHLKDHANLQYLKIASKDITDDSIPVLSTLVSLRRLWTSGTSITPHGVAKLRIELPNCEVIEETED
jgi:hypothetical protein